MISFAAFGFAFFAAALVAGVVNYLLRAKPVLTEPRCTTCDYDLRAANFMSGAPQKCPECGADLSVKGAIRWGKYVKRSRKPVVITVCLALMVPAAVIFGTRLVAPRPVAGPMAVTAMTNAQIIANLPKTVRTPWDWQELENRLRAGRITAAETDAAIAILIADLKTQKTSEPLHWSGRFVTLALQSGTLSEARMKELFQTYYRGIVQPRLSQTILREGQSLQLSLDHGNPWTIEGSFPVWCLKRVLVDDKPVEILFQNKPVAADDLSGDRGHYVYGLQLADPLPIGQHQLTLVFDNGALHQGAILRGRSGRPGTSDKWPDPIAIWETREQFTIRVASKTDPIIKLITSDDLQPLAGVKSEVSGIVIRPAQNGNEVFIRWQTKTLPVGLCSRVSIRIGDATRDLGSLVCPAGQQLYEQTYQLHEALPQGTTADLLLTPDAKMAEQVNGMERIWGKDIEIKGVPVERYDLEK